MEAGSIPVRPPRSSTSPHRPMEGHQRAKLDTAGSIPAGEAVHLAEQTIHAIVMQVRILPPRLDEASSNGKTLDF